MDDMFDTMDGIHQRSFEDIGGQYIPRDEKETTCAIRLPSNRFFEVRLRNGFLDSAGDVEIVQGRRLQHYFAYGDIVAVC